MVKTAIHLTEGFYNGLKYLAVESHRHIGGPLKTVSFCKAITVAFALLAAAAFAPALAQDTAGQNAQKPRKLTPFKWDKSVPLNAGEQPAVPAEPPVPRKESEDAWVCEKNIVHPSPAPADMKAEAVMSLGNIGMGSRHCWRKSDPAHVVDRPFRMYDSIGEAIRDSANQGFPPLKMKAPVKKKHRKTAAKGAPASPRPKPALPAAEDIAVKGGTPQLLRDP